jgi:hypothetical protein
MNSVIFLQCFRYQRSAGIPRDALRKAFGPLLQEPEADFWSLPCAAGKACTLFLEPFHEDSVHQLTVQRACHDARLWDALAAILSFNHVILYSPAAPAPLLLDETVVEHIPFGLLQVLGNPVVVRTGQEIRAAMDTSFVPPGNNALARYARLRAPLSNDKLDHLLRKSNQRTPALSAADLRERIKRLEEDLDTLVKLADALPSRAARAAAQAQRVRLQLAETRRRLHYYKSQANGPN